MNKELYPNSYNGFLQRINDELKWLGSKEGLELCLCCIEQGYEDYVAARYMACTGSGFAALKIVQSLKEAYLE